jgi:hypothetical protein
LLASQSTEVGEEGVDCCVNDREMKGMKVKFCSAAKSLLHIYTTALEVGGWEVNKEYCIILSCCTSLILQVLNFKIYITGVCIDISINIDHLQVSLKFLMNLLCFHP